MKYKYIIFDFDGVIANSNEIRFNGFEKLFSDYKQIEIGKLIDYSLKNGGTSRYKRIRYFYEEILKESITDIEINNLAEKYSKIVKKDVINADYVEGALEFIESKSKDYVLSIVSGSDQEELRDICSEKEIRKYFFEILGSPIDKEINLKDLIEKNKWNPKECIYIGDAITDYNAAKYANIDFIASDSGTTNWNELNIPFIKNLTELNLKLTKELG